MALNTDRPFYSIRAIPEGKAAKAIDLTERVLTFKFLDEERKADKLTLTLDNWDLSVFDDPTFKKGTILEFVWGYPGRVAPARRAVIQRIKGGRQVTIEAHGLAMLMHKVKKTRTFSGMTLEQIAAKILSEYTELAPLQRSGQIKVEGDSNTAHEHRVQAAETDATFLTRLARRHGLEFYIDSTGMHFKPRNFTQGYVKELVWFNGSGEFLDFDIDNNLAKRPGAVTKRALDPLSKKTIEHRADNDSSKRPGLAPVIEMVDPRTGKRTLQARVAEEHTEHTSETTASGVRSHADAKFRQTQHETIHMSIKLVGDPDVAAKRVLKVSGVGKRMSGLYYVTQAEHDITNAGYIVTAKAKTDGHGGYGQHNISSKAAHSKGNEAKQSEIEVVDPRTGGRHIEFRKKGEEHHE